MFQCLKILPNPPLLKKGADSPFKKKREQIPPFEKGGLGGILKSLRIITQVLKAAFTRIYND